MEYLPNALLCLESSQQGQNAHVSSVSKNGRYDGDSTVFERKRGLSANTSFISPVTRLLKTSVALVNNTVLTIRDGLTEEQRMAKIKLEERRQILHLRLKNVCVIRHLTDRPQACTAKTNGDRRRICLTGKPLHEISIS